LNNFPQHLAIIMDGNRRWAKQQGLAIVKGHRKMTDEMIERLADECIRLGIPYLTLWAFSTENWKRDQAEVKDLMMLFREMLTKQIHRLHKKNVRVNVIGDISAFDQDIQANVKKGMEQTKDNTSLTLTFALNYGGRDELTRVVKKIIQMTKAGDISIENITPEFISQQLDTAYLPDPDLIIRPGGELRLSGYLPWQGVYAELYFTDVLMPDFDEQELKKALEEYANRQRRFGAG
jgi:undecaprenyl diphosphate synthase